MQATMMCRVGVRVVGWARRQTSLWTASGQVAFIQSSYIQCPQLHPHPFTSEHFLTYVCSKLLFFFCPGRGGGRYYYNFEPTLQIQSSLSNYMSREVQSQQTYAYKHYNIWRAVKWPWHTQAKRTSIPRLHKQRQHSILHTSRGRFHF